MTNGQTTLTIDRRRTFQRWKENPSSDVTKMFFDSKTNCWLLLSEKTDSSANRKIIQWNCSLWALMAEKIVQPFRSGNSHFSETFNYRVQNRQQLRLLDFVLRVYSQGANKTGMQFFAEFHPLLLSLSLSLRHSAMIETDCYALIQKCRSVCMAVCTVNILGSIIIPSTQRHHLEFLLIWKSECTWARYLLYILNNTEDNNWTTVHTLKFHLFPQNFMDQKSLP